jgi:hypothetical protein
VKLRRAVCETLYSVAKATWHDTFQYPDSTGCGGTAGGPPGLENIREGGKELLDALADGGRGAADQDRRQVQLPVCATLPANVEIEQLAASGLKQYSFFV